MLDHKLDPGQMDVRIGLLAPSETAQDTGDVSESFTLSATVWGLVEYPNSGQREDVMADKLTAARTVKATIRNYSALNERYRLRIYAQDYDILTIAYLGRREFMVIEAERRL